MMKTRTLFSLATCISLLTPVSTPVLAETVTAEIVPHQTNSLDGETVPHSTPDTTKETIPFQPLLGNITIPKNTAIIVSFPTPMTIDVTEKQDIPLTVLLAHAIRDAQGNVIVPENSPVSIMIKPEDGGAKIVAQSLVINGQVVSIQASSPKIPGTTITHKGGHEKAEESGSVWGKIGESAFGFASGGKAEYSERGSMLGRTLGLVTGLSSPNKSRVINIGENSVYVLSLEATVELSTPE